MANGLILPQGTYATSTTFAPFVTNTAYGGGGATYITNDAEAKIAYNDGYRDGHEEGYGEGWEAALAWAGISDDRDEEEDND